MTQSGSLDKPQRHFSQITTQLAWRRSRPVRAPWSFSISSCLRLRLTYRIFVIVNKNHKTHRIGPKHVCVCVYIHCCEFTFEQLIQHHQNLKQMHFLLLPQQQYVRGNVSPQLIPKVWKPNIIPNMCSAVKRYLHPSGFLIFR